MNIAIIPARSGSKRIPNKNIKKFKGLPIISWTMKAILRSNIFDKIIVSTDSEKIARISKNLKAEVPFIRPKLISNDYASTTDVIKHAVNWLKIKKISPSFVCCIYPTAAYIDPKDIVKGFNKIKKNKLNYVFSAGKYQSSIFRSFKKKKNKGLEMNFPKYYNKRTQDIFETFYDAGQFYWGTPDAWLKAKPIFSKKSGIIEISKLKIHDIDTLQDWKLAEKMWKFKNLK